MDFSDLDERWKKITEYTAHLENWSLIYTYNGEDDDVEEEVTFPELDLYGFYSHRPPGAKWKNCEILLDEGFQWRRYWRVKTRTVGKINYEDEFYVYASVREDYFRESDPKLNFEWEAGGGHVSTTEDPFLKNPVVSARIFVDTHGDDIKGIIEKSKEPLKTWIEENSASFDDDEDSLILTRLELIETPMNDAFVWKDNCDDFKKHEEKWKSVGADEDVDFNHEYVLNAVSNPRDVEDVLGSYDYRFLLETINDFTMREVSGAARAWVTMENIKTNHQTDPIEVINNFLYNDPGKKQRFFFLPEILRRYPPIMLGLLEPKLDEPAKKRQKQSVCPSWCITMQIKPTLLLRW